MNKKLAFFSRMTDNTTSMKFNFGGNLMSKYALALLVSLAIAPVAFAPEALAATKGLDSSFTAMSKSGTHQFYVWCTGRRDSEQTARGNNAREAQAALARKVGGRCWPVWQGMR